MPICARCGAAYSEHCCCQCGNPGILPMTAMCYCKHQYIGHVSLSFTNTSLECLVDNCDCRRFKWTTKDKARFEKNSELAQKR